MLEIQFTGRGGQGVVVAAQLLGLAFFKAGQYPQCYSVFGGERRGAPLIGYLRVDSEKILLKCDIQHPDELICLDDTLFDPEKIRDLLKPGGRILINTRKPESYLQGLENFQIGLIDALAISESVGLGRIFNTAMLGAYAKFSGRISLDFLTEAVREMVPAKLDTNLEAMRRAHGAVRFAS